jgi:hypothetical protein
MLRYFLGWLFMLGAQALSISPAPKEFPQSKSKAFGNSLSFNRRAMVGSFGSFFLFGNSQLAKAAIIEVDRCDNGVGPGCTEDSSPLINELRAKSALNKDKREIESLRRYNENNYGDFFAASWPPKKLVLHQATNKYEAINEQDLADLIKYGKVKSGELGSKAYYFVE